MFLGELYAEEMIRTLGEYRKMTSSEIVEHLHDIYSLTLPEIYQSKNLMKYIDKYKNASSIYDGVSMLNKSYGRDEFNKKIRNEYVKHSNNYFGGCELSLYMVPQDVHHCFPIVYGGSNCFKNLFYICNTFHNMLHNNPYEHLREYCFIALDHLTFYSRLQTDMVHANYGSRGDKILASKKFIYKVETRMNKLYQIFSNVEKERVV